MIECGTCGQSNPAGTEFCTNCGRFLEWTKPSSTELAARTPQRPNARELGAPELRDPVITLDPPTSRVAPGESLVLKGRVKNASSIVDRFDLAIVGPLAAWSKIEPATVSLYPGTENEVRLEFRPPRGPDLPAGPISVGLRATTAAPEVRMATVEVIVEVAPVPDASAEISPRTSRAMRSGRHTVSITNRGNAPWRAIARAIDPDAALNLAVQPEAVEVASGTTGTLRVTPRGKGFNWFGAPDATSFKVELRPTEGGAPISLDARFEQTSLIRRLPLAVAGGLLAVGIIGVGVLAGWIPPGRGPTPPPASLATAGAGTVTPAPPNEPPPTETTAPSQAPPTETTPPTEAPAVATWAIDAANAIGGFGNPVDVTVPTEDGVGAYQAFDNGVVYLRPDGTAVPMFGDILGTWRCRLAGQGGTGCPPGRTGPLAELGYPSDREQRQDGEPYQIFDLGGIYCLRGCGYIVFGPVNSIWQDLRSSGIGLPVRDVVATTEVGDWWLGRFEQGFIFAEISGEDFVACMYDARIIQTSMGLTDCSGFASAVPGIP